MKRCTIFLANHEEFSFHPRSYFFDLLLSTQLAGSFWGGIGSVPNLAKGTCRYCKVPGSNPLHADRPQRTWQSAIYYAFFQFGWFSIFLSCLHSKIADCTFGLGMVVGTATRRFDVGDHHAHLLGSLIAVACLEWFECSKWPAKYRALHQKNPTCLR